MLRTTPLTLVVCFLGCLHLTSAVRKEPFRVDPTQHRFVDGFGRIRIFRGQNYVYKGFPWYPAEVFNDTIVQDMADWGFNTLRLGLMWSGAEPSRGAFNATYISIMKEAVGRLRDAGIYSFLDMHQDCMSSRYGLYDGFPRWLLDLGNSSPPEHPWPYPWASTPSAWADNCLTQAEDHSWGLFYGNFHGMRDAHAAFWRRMAAEFRDVNGVLGYELVNEPFAGDVWADPLLFLPGEAGRRSLMPLYEAVSKAVRQEDNATILFAEPVTWGMILNGEVLSSGLQVPGGKEYADRFVFSFHYYCWVYNQGSASRLQRAACDAVLGPQVMRAVRNDVADMGGAAMMTEWGMCVDTKGENRTRECVDIMSRADEEFLSWTYWDATGGRCDPGCFYDPAGHRVLERIRAFARPYAQAIAGVPRGMRWDAAEGVFTFSFVPSATIDTAVAPTVIFLPAVHFEQRPRVTACDEATVSLQRNGSVAEISFRGTVPTNPCVVRAYAPRAMPT
eukprot:TRINITY_DN934_c0_g1_i1.p1 TRINITY_DN934_c0_g1~~TRINITY_DN934_c0_g1_i1.p1  ORF type:complete len:503 (+),score=54.14 TRINITY_DN934_c0_g1_i1:132-1640(+)